MERIRVKLWSHQLTGRGLLLWSPAEEGSGSRPPSPCSGNGEKVQLSVGVLGSFLATYHLADV